jgi:hypothetical protein
MANLKRQGFRSGVPDYLLPVPVASTTAPNGDTWFKQVIPGLWLELKRADGVPSDVSVDQSVFMADMADLGWDAQVAFGAAHAQEIITEYLGRTGSPVAFGYLVGQEPSPAWLDRRIRAGMRDALG